MTKDKYGVLVQNLDTYTKKDVAVAFSGGVDSSLLLKAVCSAAEKNGTNVYAITAHTKLHPHSDLEISQRVASEIGAVHRVVTIDELEETGIRFNPENRCYLCKKGIFSKIRLIAEEAGVQLILDGTNEDDLHQYRPGIKALGELGVISPLADAGLTKAEIRELAGELGISVAHRPSTPCLATRLPYGAELSYELLERIESCEGQIRELGFYNVRVRAHQNIARIEVDEADLSKALEQRHIITDIIKKQSFSYVTIDLEGFRSGSMDVDILK